MNILQVLPELNYGGVETGVADFVKYLTANGHKAVVVSAGGPLVKTIEAQGAKHYSLPVHKKSLFSMLKCMRELAKVIQREEIQIVHARSRVPAWIAYFASRITRTVFITTCHGYYSKNFLSKVMGWGKFVIVPSQIIGRRMIDDFIVPFERIKFIPRGVDSDKFTFILPEARNRTEFVIAVIGRITPIKGHMCFIKAIQKVSRTIPNIKVWIIGSSPKSKMRYKEDLEILVKRLGLSCVVEFLGVRQDIGDLFSRINLVVLPSIRHEAFGRVIIEAQAAGIPVVATKVGGAVDIIDDGITGLLAAPDNPDSMAEAIIRVLRDNQLASVMAKNALSKLQSKFTLAQMSRKTIEVYQEALSSKRVLVIKLSALGDLILSIPALKAIRKKFPAPCIISCLIGKDIAAVLANCPYVDEQIVYDFKSRDKGFLNTLKVASILRKKCFDTAIDLQNNRKSHLLSYLSCASVRYGYANGKWGFFLNKKIREDKFVLGPIEHQFRILKMLEIDLKDKKIELWPSKEDIKYVGDFLDSQWLAREQAAVGIHLSSSQRWVTKRWPLDYIGQLCERLALLDIRVIITGDQIQKEELKLLSETTKKSKPIIACGKTNINQLACLIKRCKVFISPDSAPLHIACGTGVNVIALFGPTDPRRHIPEAQNVTIIKKELPCQPCYKSDCAAVDCMRQISVDEVYEAVLKLIPLGQNSTKKL